MDGSLRPGQRETSIGLADWWLLPVVAPLPALATPLPVADVAGLEWDDEHAVAANAAHATSTAVAMVFIFTLSPLLNRESQTTSLRLRIAKEKVAPGQAFMNARHE
jgi:hypothetical protein